MKISVVVPAFNEEKLIVKTLRQIQNAAGYFLQRNWEMELIVCDNNSTDRTSELARAAGARVVFEPVNQIARARNRGASAATGDWLIFVDADSLPSRELFTEVAEQIESGRALAGGATVKLETERRWARWLTRGWNGISRARKFMAGSFIFCDAEAFRAIGGFSEKLFASEEIDLSIRLKKLAHGRGKRIVILHRHPILTSPRKMHLYSGREYFRFFARTIFAGGRTLRDRDACFPWYDGRR